MNSLVFSNFLHRPARTVVSILGIALGVLLIVFTYGLANGSMRSKASREANVNAEILFCPKGTICVTGKADFRLPVSQAKEIEAVEGVKTVVPIGQVTVDVSDNNTGQRLIDGINFDTYKSVVGISIIEGKTFEPGKDEAIIDTGFQSQKGIKVGDKISLWEREFTVAGTYEPAAGARVKVPLNTMQETVGGENKATGFLIKIKEGFSPSDVAKNIDKEFPESKIFLTSELEELYMQSIPALGVFLNVIVGVAAVISALVILLTMYTTVTERTRQIGIMKSLGMSNPGIAWIVTQEALLISAFGIFAGFLFTIILRFLMTFFTTLTVEIKWETLAIVTIVGLLGGALGGLYPALRAARLDAVDALGYE